MIIREDTITYFEQDKPYVQDYLKSRGLKNRELFSIISNYPFALLEDARFVVEENEYEITHFLSKSDIAGYDIKKVNELFKLDLTEKIAIAVVAGDDLLCYNTKKRNVYLWKIQTGDSEEIVIPDSLTKFLKSINK